MSRRHRPRSAERWQSCILCGRNYRTAADAELCSTCFKSDTVSLLLQRSVAKIVDALVLLSGHDQPSCMGTIVWPHPVVVMVPIKQCENEDDFCVWPCRAIPSAEVEEAPDGMHISGGGSVMIDGKMAAARDGAREKTRLIETEAEHSGRTTTPGRRFELPILGGIPVDR